MATVTRDRLHELIEALSDDDLDAVGRVLGALVDDEPAVRRDGVFSAGVAGASAGALPAAMTAESLQADFWPEEESAEEVVATIDRWRAEGGDA